MSWRSWFGGAAVVGYLAILAQVTTATTCPAREPGACEKVHALMRTRPAMIRVLMLAEPMTSRTSQAPLQLATLAR